MAKENYFSTYEVKEIVDKYKAGATVKSLCKEYFCSSQTIRNYLNKFEVKRGQKKTPESTKIKCYEMKQQGFTYAEISKELGVSNTTIWSACKELKGSKEEQEDDLLKGLTVVSHEEEKKAKPYTDKRTGKKYIDVTGVYLHQNEV